MKTYILSLLFLVLAAGPLQADDFDGGEIDNNPVVALSRAAAFAQVQSNAGNMLTGLYANNGDFTPDEFRNTLYDLTEDLYTSGHISLAQLNGKLAEIDACLAAHQQVLVASTNLNKSIRQQRCGAAVDYSALEAAQPTCVPANGVQAGAQCCSGLVQGVSPTLEAATSGKKTNAACTGHAECASKICSKSYGASAGICAPLVTCMVVNALDSECSAENPNCAGGVCQRVMTGQGGVSCKVTEQACAANNDCCSDKCVSNKCVDKYMCQNCVAEGVSPAAGQVCCRGLIKDLDNKCTLEMPPFILPSKDASYRPRPSLWKRLASNLWGMSAQATEIENPAVIPGSDTNSSQGTWVNDDALSEAQLDFIETEIKKILDIKDKEQRKQALLKIYAERKKMTAANAAAVKAGQKVGKLYTQEEYVKRYNIPAIKPKERSNVERCEFDTGKDNWLDSSNMLRNADLFLRAFEVSYSGKGTQDLWHLLDKSEKPNKDNLYTRTKGLMSELRDNRNMQRDQLKYLDLMMACQCLYTFGPEKFDAEKQAFFYSQCGQERPNRICRDGEMRDTLKLPDSAEAAYREGKEFPNYVEMYFQKLTKMQGQSAPRVDAQGRPIRDDVDNIDSGAAGINHEEILVRWLRLRSCNQLDVFIDTEKVETELQTVAEDLNRAKKPVARLTNYWNQRLSQMASGGVDSKIIDVFRQDTKKDTWYRGYVHTESKVHSWKKKTFKFLLFLILALLVVGVGALLFAVNVVGSLTGFLAAAGGILGVGVVAVGMQSNPKGGAEVLQALAKDFPAVIIEDRLVEKKSCGFLKLFYCKTFYRILHWPAFSNRPGIENSFPWKKREERSCDDTHAAAIGYGGVEPNPCSGPFKGTMCARSFFRPVPDGKIEAQAEFQPWKEFMRDRTLMDPVTPEFFGQEVNLDNKWVQSMNDGFKKGCAWAKGLGKAKPKPEDKLRFFPDIDKYMDAQTNFKPEFTWDQPRIDAYKAAVKKYALCKNLNECGAQSYDGVYDNPWGFADIFCPNDGKPCSPESVKNAELFADYVYQLHFNWRHMSGESGIGYPLAFLENYYLALLYNVRLLTTLSIRRGIELDDAFNRYADDLAIRRSRYQINSDQYDLTMGKEQGRQQVTGSVFRSFTSLGFPLSAEFVGLPGNTNLPGSATGSQTADGRTLNNFELNALNAARRTAARVARDNMAWKNYQDKTKGDANASKRLSAAQKALGRLNSPLSAVSGMARPGEGMYSGIGGKMDLNTASMGTKKMLGDGKNDGSETKQKYGAAQAGEQGGASAGASAGAAGGSAGNGGFGSNSGSGSGADSGYGLEGLAGANSGSGGGVNSAGAAGDAALDDAARLTGMKTGDVQNMLESADKNRNKGLSGSENDSLFEKVSKAYMRNLERVLIRTKGPDKGGAPAKKEVDPEKEELKKIFAQ